MMRNNTGSTAPKMGERETRRVSQLVVPIIIAPPTFSAVSRIATSTHDSRSFSEAGTSSVFSSTLGPIVGKILNDGVSVLFQTVWLYDYFPALPSITRWNIMTFEK